MLYYAIGFHSKSSRQMDSLEFLLGIVGPHSYAEETQKKVHELCNNDILNGWDNQLKDEPVLGVFYDRKWKLRQSKISSGFSHDLIPHMGVGFGNALIYAHAGAGLRFGWNLPIQTLHLMKRIPVSFAVTSGLESMFLPPCVGRGFCETSSSMAIPSGIVTV
jgi:hypothetical protein